MANQPAIQSKYAAGEAGGLDREGVHLSESGHF